MRRTLWLLLLSTSVAAAEDPQATKTVDLLIVAGQSNAVGFDAPPGELPARDADQEVMFWWRCGDPPPDEHDSTSQGSWTHLKPQPLGNPKQPKQDRQYGNFAQPDGGFGPEMGFARTLYSHEKKPLAVIKIAFSGTSMNADWNHADPGDGGSCYRALISETQAAISAAKEQGIDLRPRALSWVQGESDARSGQADNYAQALGAMLTAVRHDLVAPEMIALVAVNTRFSEGTNPFMPTIVAQQRLLASRDPRCEYVDTSSASIANNAHFDAKGTLKVGRLFAEALLRVEKQLQPQGCHITIVTLGDSITKGVRNGVTAQQTFASLIGESLHGVDLMVHVHNVGIGGERTDQALLRLDKIIALQPDIVTVMYGTNDSYVDQGKADSRITLHQYRDNLGKIVTELLRRGILPVLMTEPRWAEDSPLNGLGEHPNVRLESYIDACRGIAMLWRVPLVDHYAKWTDAHANGVNLLDWTTDGCHPNPVGHREIADTMSPVLRKAIGPHLETRRKLLSGEPVRVVCFGDSVTGVYYHTGSRRAYTNMLGIALRRIAPRSDVVTINAGVSGHTTADALARIDRDVLAHKPDLVTVMFGLNDMTRVPLDRYRANLTQIVAKCRAIDAEVVLATPNNVISAPQRPTQKLLRYCDIVREVANELNVTLCDSYRELDAVRSADGFDWRLLMSDAIHPNMDGHKRIAMQLARSIAGLHCSLDGVAPPRPAIAATLAALKAGKPVRVLAMDPLGTPLEKALQSLAPNAVIEVMPWATDGMSLAEIEQEAKTRVRATKPDLVLLAVPRSAATASDEAFVSYYAWILNWSMNFGPPTWDCVVVHPSVVDPNTDDDHRDNIIRRLVPAHDLNLIDRGTANSADASSVLLEWVQQQATGTK